VGSAQPRNRIGGFATASKRHTARESKIEAAEGVHRALATSSQAAFWGAAGVGGLKFVWTPHSGRLKQGVLLGKLTIDPNQWSADLHKKEAAHARAASSPPGGNA
jgi:hypothetical protein